MTPTKKDICRHGHFDSYMSWWLKSGIKPSSFMVAVALFAKIKRKDIAVISTSAREISEETGMSRATVLRSVKELESAGILKKNWTTGEAADYEFLDRQPTTICDTPYSKIRPLSKLDHQQIDNTPTTICDTPCDNLQQVHYIEDNKGQRPKNIYIGDDDFEKFWEVYPSHRRNMKKAEAKGVISEIVKSGVDIQKIIQSIEGHKDKIWRDTISQENGKFVPGMKKWLDERRWEVDTVVTGTTNYKPKSRVQF